MNIIINLHYSFNFIYSLSYIFFNSCIRNNTYIYSLKNFRNIRNTGSGNNMITK